MENVKHTPGKWRVTEGTMHPHRRIFSEDENIGYVVDHTATAEANANLIAAAPELLEALENLLQQLRFSRLPKIDVKKDYSLMVALEFAKTTIAKAEGR